MVNFNAFMAAVQATPTSNFNKLKPLPRNASYFSCKTYMSHYSNVGNMKFKYGNKMFRMPYEEEVPGYKPFHPLEDEPVKPESIVEFKTRHTRTLAVIESKRNVAHLRSLQLTRLLGAARETREEATEESAKRHHGS
ncbi:hypothetical protein HDU98_002963 [Podochytrium sp. JEL0797]|nr:hypothetical protein HDU98_002963 [Podochytrium sp. JEL0797]